MRILQVISCFYPAWAYGGPVSVAFNLSKELVKRGHEVVVYTTDTIDRNTRQGTKYLEIEGIKVHYFRNISNRLASRNLFCAPGMLFQLRKEIRNFDIVHLHDYRSFQSIMVHYYAKKYGVPYVLQAHGSATTRFGKVTLKKIFDLLFGHRITRDASRLIALTQAEAEQYGNMGISKDRIEIVPNGIDLSEFEDLPKRGKFREKYGLNNSEKIILYLGRIHSIKGLDLLAGAFANIPNDFDDVRLVIVGPDDGYLPALKESLRALKIKEKALVTGPLYGQEKLEAYVDADVYVLPSIYETFPMSVLEACACGTPVIITDRCGIANLINGQAGLVVPYDKEELRRALRRMLSDDKMSQEFGRHGKLLVREQFNWLKIANQIENVYQDGGKERSSRVE